MQTLRHQRLIMTEWASLAKLHGIRLRQVGKRGDFCEIQRDDIGRCKVDQRIFGTTTPKHARPSKHPSIDESSKRNFRPNWRDATCRPAGRFKDEIWPGQLRSIERC